MRGPRPRSTLFPYTTLFRSVQICALCGPEVAVGPWRRCAPLFLPGLPPAGVLPGERGEVGLDPAGPGPWAGQRRRMVEPGQQALAEQGWVVVGERGEVVVAAFGRVVPDQFHPGPADG